MSENLITPFNSQRFSMNVSSKTERFHFLVLMMSLVMINFGTDRDDLYTRYESDSSVPEKPLVLRTDPESSEGTCRDWSHLFDEYRPLQFILLSRTRLKCLISVKRLPFLHIPQHIDDEGSELACVFCLQSMSVRFVNY